MELSHLQVLISAIGVVITFTTTSAITFWKMIDKRLTSGEILAEARNIRTADAILNLSKAIAEASGKTMTVENCVKNTRLQDDKLNSAITDLKVATHLEIKEVETRLDKRLTDVEKKVYGK